MIVPRPAATLILCRDRLPGAGTGVSGPGGIEVLLLQRTYKAVFMPGVYVFPGGAVDTADNSDSLHPHVSGLTPADADGLLEVEQGGLGYLAAALRECFEEAGLLLARAPNGTLQQMAICDYISHESEGLAARCTALRKQMLEGDLTLSDLCQSLGVSLPLDRLAYLSRWVTPEGPPRRFDTRFFIAKAPAGQVASHDGQETIGHLWISPEEALARNHRGEISLARPTQASLQMLLDFANTDDLMMHFHKPGPVPGQPRPATGSMGRRVIEPDHAAYPEVVKLDPQGEGTAHYEIQPGAVTVLSPTVRRITAPNPGAMTGPGTNTYILGQGRHRAVIDPGPAIDSHLDAILKAVEEQGGQLRWILVTHTHRDHSPGAARLKSATGATVLGLSAPEDDYQDRSFIADSVLAHGETIRAEDFSLRAIHTPGHASNHVCYLHEQDGLLFSGDHIMQGSTVVINPPDGDMAAYLASLATLRREGAHYIAPGHGFLMDQPERVIDRLVAHRQKREDKLVAALAASGPVLERTLLPIVYDDVPAAVHPLAHRSMLAHLYKLQGEKRAARKNDRWVLIES